jgi:hypothetical protein
MGFKPGQSGNPAGRPKGAHSLHNQAIWREVGEEIDTNSGKEKYKKLVELVYEQALGGDVRSQALIFDRTDGKSSQTITLVPEQPAYDLDALSDEELKQLEEDRKSVV